jgi:pimeloyl-ACP methyl ester carboxylesterase
VPPGRPWHVAVAVDLAQRCGGKRFVVMGHSFGGAVAIGAPGDGATPY